MSRPEGRKGKGSGVRVLVGVSGEQRWQGVCEEGKRRMRARSGALLCRWKDDREVPSWQPGTKPVQIQETPAGGTRHRLLGTSWWLSPWGRACAQAGLRIRESPGASPAVCDA